MTTRTDVDLELFTSPRVLEVREPSTEMVMQDLVDTTRKLEDAFSGMGFPKLVNASGKEDLGGGVRVGITVAMQNLLLAFASRTTPAQTGTVTSNPGSAVQGRDSFIDTAATFQTNGVQRGSLVINFTDQSIADVISVDSETQLTTKTLVNGVGNTYDVSDVYHVFNVVQVNATGGNLVAVDDVQAAISAILPTAFTQVVLTASSSATLQEQADIQFASFNGAVTVDVVNGVSGTEFPIGTRRQPVQNVPDAVDIATSRGINTLVIRGDITLDTGDVLPDFIIRGQSPTLTAITINPGAQVDGAEFIRATVSGTLDGDALVRDCYIGTLMMVNGTIQDSLLTGGTITLGGGVQANILNCWDGTAGLSLPTIDFGGSGQALILRGYAGGIRLANKSGSEDASLDVRSGRIVVEDTVTGGDILLRGLGKWDNKDTYVGGANVVDEMVDGAQLQILSKIMRNRMETNPTTGVMTVYDDDNVTPLLTGNIYEDVLASQVYRGRGIERRERLE